MLAMPWPTSSTFGLCLVPLMRSETTADISDSIAPSMATVIAGAINGRSKSARNCGILIPGKPDGMPPKRVPIVSTGSFSSITSAVPANRATMYPGTRFTNRMKTRITMSADTPRPGFERRKRMKIPRESFHASQKFSRNLVDFEAEEILDLRAGDDHRDAVRESHNHRARNVFHRGAEPGDAQNDEQHARHQRAHEQAVQAVPRHDAVDDHDERARGAADLRRRSAQRGNQEPRHDGAIQSRLRRNARSDRKRHRQRQRDEPTVTPARASAANLCQL